MRHYKKMANLVLENLTALGVDMNSIADGFEPLGEEVKLGSRDDLIKLGNKADPVLQKIAKLSGSTQAIADNINALIAQLKSSFSTDEAATAASQLVTNLE